MTFPDRMGWASLGVVIFAIGSVALQLEHGNAPAGGSGYNAVAYNQVTAVYHPVPTGRYPTTPASGALTIEPPRTDPVTGVLQPR